MSKMRKATNIHVLKVDMAYDHLQKARDLLKVANAPKTLARVRSALKSCEGAMRHVRHRLHRTENPRPVSYPSEGAAMDMRDAIRGRR
jgi:hypothetical protein